MSTHPEANEQNPLYVQGDLIPADEVPADDRQDVDSVCPKSLSPPQNIDRCRNDRSAGCVLTICRSQSSTTSISSSILEYRRIHGRTYHSEKFATNYFIPNDDRQLESVELSHHALTILLDDQLFLAPLEKDKIHRVLDVGTGSGIWAIDFADQFPHSSVIGTDLSPCQPQWVPPNVQFEIDDATLDWTWNANHFDFIHIRYILGGIQDWTAFLREAYRCCAPGGWVESTEYDVEFRSDDGTTELEPILASAGDLYREAGEVLNRPFFLQEIQQQAFEEAGFIDKRMVRYKMPVGPWPKDPKLAEVGRCLGAALGNDLQGYTQMLWQSLQKPEDEYHTWLATLRKAIRNPKVHGYMIVHIVYGRKPE